jgi:DNA gyrase subunit A
MPDEEQQETGVRIRLQPIEEEMQRSYIDYAMSVIVGRALPDVRDGLKPVQRRILYGMSELGMSSGSQFKKAARVVGEILGKFHPHGDTAVYDALARMVQDFSLRYPLIQGQGNWGSTEDEPAAMRYTECRLSKVAEDLLQDIEKDTVEWGDNFDGTLKEPLVLPGKFPNLLVNGSSGIAVGMATNMPPHNLGEVVDGLILLIDNPNATLSDLYNPETGPIRGPDFPTGAVLNGVAGITEAYSTGRGLISLRAKAGFEEAKGDKVRIVITEIPYFVNKGALVESIALLVKQKRIEGVTDLRDESDREGMRIVLELKRDAVEDVVLNQLYHHTQMDSTFGIINLALVDGQPRVLGLRPMLQSYIGYRVEVVRNRTQFDLNKARQREHIVEGLLTAIDHLDDVIRIIRRARDAEDASVQLRTRYLLSEDQTKAILDMSLRKLTGLETQALRTEQDQLKKTIVDLEGILASKERVLEIIKSELRELKEKYGDSRRTAIEVHASEMEVEDLIPEENNVIIITNSHYVKRLSVSEYRLQGRAGKGTIGIQTKEEDFVVDAFVANTHDYLLCFTTAGKVFWLKAFRVPKGSRYSRGKPIINLLERLQPGEAISAMIPVRDFSEEEYLVFATRQGVVKRTAISSYGRPMVTGIKAIRLREGDEVVDVLKAKAADELVVVKSGGRAVRFPIMDVRDVSRNSIGVRGVKLRNGDRVIGMVVANDARHMLTVSTNGYAKRTAMKYDSETSKGFPTRSRAGLGVIAMKVNTKTGPVVDALIVSPGDELLASTKNGMAIRCEADSVSEQGRNASGVRLILLDGLDEVVAVAHLAKEETAAQSPGKTPDEVAGGPAPPAGS